MLDVEKGGIAIIGGGSWATALTKIITSNGHKVHWWMRNTKALDHLKTFRHHPNYLQSVEFDLSKIVFSNDLSFTIREAEIIIIVVPSAYLNETFKDISADNFSGKTVFSAVKGIVPEYNAIPARFLHKSFLIPYENIGIICGPCHAEEVAMERLSYLTIASSDESKAEKMSSILANRYIRTAISDDLFGTELSAVLKNVYALAAGICSGLGYGDNFQSVLISNAVQEIERFIDVVSPVHRDTKTSAYLGDLLVTAYSNFSRNRTFGFMIGKGYSVKNAQLEMNMVAEGYYATKSLTEINLKFQVYMPILEMVNSVIYQGISPQVAVKILSDKLT
jgi:glycerol-3-phosphate dehydrogenase (NAD(P)+)